MIISTQFVVTKNRKTVKRFDTLREAINYVNDQLKGIVFYTHTWDNRIIFFDNLDDQNVFYNIYVKFLPKEK